MDKWFEDKFEKNRLRQYTKRRLYRNSGNSRKIFRIFSLTNWIIIINIIIYFLILILTIFFAGEKIVSLVGLKANKFFSGGYWVVFTSMFVHFEAWHMLANMVSLFFLGNLVERIIGRKRFFWLYLISGIFAGLFYVFLSYYFGGSIIGAKLFGSPDIAAVGASGAIFSLVGILAVLIPYNKVYMIIGPIIALVLQSILASFFPTLSIIPILSFLISIYVIFSLISIFSFNSSFIKIAFPVEMPLWLLPIVAIIPLMTIGLFIQLPIGNTAHLGGLLAGLVYGFYLRKKYRQKTDMIRRYFAN